MAKITVRGVLLDLGGVVYVGDTPLPGAFAAIQRLRQTELALRFMTNTTRRSTPRLLADLAKIGLDLAPEELLTPAQLARTYLVAHRLTPHLLVHANLEEEFADLPSDLAPGQREAVVVGDAAERFSFENLNTAYRKLEAGAGFLALAENRNFMDADGQLSIDAGAFVRALEYASSRRATVLGKPSQMFFRLAVEALGCAPGEAVMVGDDAEADVGGALAAGLAGVLVRTGKYRPGDEDALDPPPTQVADDLAAAVDWILDLRQK
jgi:HAD superfamily hydrolase (TIGR01458 family)